MNDQGQPGRPETPKSTLEMWLGEMAIFLKNGSSLFYAIEKSNLMSHKDTIYREYKKNGWFCEKIDMFRRTPGELVNEFFVKEIKDITDKQKEGRAISSDEFKNMRWFAEKSRTAQPFFVTRQEVQETDDSKVGKILDNLESDYDDVGSQAQKQVVEAEQSLQDQEQGGAPDNVQAEPGTTPTPGGAG